MDSLNRGWKVLVACVLVGAVVSVPAPGQPADPPKAPEKEPAKQPPKEEPAKKPEEPKPAAKPAKEQFVYVTLKTSMGDIVLELDQEKAPISVENFTRYVDAGFYNGTIFHRVINGFMVQGGGFTADSLSAPKKTNAPIKNEWKNGLKNLRGTIAMARTNVADSATSQFFINVKDNTFLDEPRDGAAYAVFGRVMAGMDVVDKIKAVKTTTRQGMADVPETAITIEKASRLSAEDAAKLRK
jgi:cyclophilin family peptidyl-prolyl cis-trans isomerase